MIKTAIVNSSSFGKYFPEHLESLMRIGAVDIFTFKADESDAVLIEALRDYDYIISSVTPNYTRSFFEACSKLKIISRHGIGYNNIDVEAANDHQVYITKVEATVEKDAVAEQAIALLMSLSRKVVDASQAAQAGRWDQRASFMGYQLQGKTAGVIGYGNIGSRVATILKHGFNMRVLAHDAMIPHDVTTKINDIEFVDLDTLVANSHFISLNAYLDSSSYHLIDDSMIAKMRSDVLVVNTARGALVDDKAIVKAVKDKHIAGYATDVVEGEPIDESHYLLGQENILVTPHTAAYTWECLRGMGEKCVEDILRVHEGRVPKGQVTNL